jgi:hypothetical protein
MNEMIVDWTQMHVYSNGIETNYDTTLNTLSYGDGQVLLWLIWWFIEIAVYFAQYYKTVWIENIYSEV